MTIPPELHAALSAIWAIPGGEQTPEKTPGGGVSLESMARPHVIPFADDAKNLIHSVMDECDRLAFDGDDGGEEAAAATIWGRAAEHTIKIALIHALSRCGADVLSDKVTLPDVSWAWLLVRTLSARLVKQIEQNVHASDFEKWCLDAQNAIIRYRKHEALMRRDKPGAPWYVIEKALKGATPKQAKDVRDKLIQMNRLRVMPAWRSSPKSKKTLDLFCLVEEKEVKDE